MKRGRLRLLVTVFAVLGLLLLAGEFWTKSAYQDFVSHPAPYFAEVARACNSMLKEHHGLSSGFLKLAGNDPSLPVPLLELRANEVRVYPNRVWIGFDAEKDSFAILWEPQFEDPTSWALMTDHNGTLKPRYVEQK